MIKKYEHGGNIYSAQRKTGDSHVLDFSANINPVGLSEKVRQTLLDNIDNVVHYPDAEAYQLRKSICRHYGIKEEMLVLGNGATELFYILVHVLKPEKIFLPVPSFSEYEKSSLCIDVQVEYFLLPCENNFVVNYEEMLHKIPSNALIFLGNPNNPTGKLLEREGLENFLQKTWAKNCKIILDESFIDFLECSDYYSLLRFCYAYDHVFLVHSLTKIFAIPGLRLGFGVFPQAWAKKVEGAKDCWNVNNLAQAAGIAALDDKEYLKKSKILVKEYRDNFYKELASIKAIKIYPSEVNFLLLDIKNTGMTSAQLCSEMAKHSVLLRDCANYHGLDDGYVRVAVRNKAENREFTNILKKVCEING